MTKKILVIPSVRQGNGGGHLQRMISLVSSAPDLFALFLDREGRLNDAPLLDLTAYRGTNPPEVSFDELKDNEWRYIILDQRETPTPLFTALLRLAPLLGIDEGGQHREEFDFLIDSLPRLDTSRQNLIAPGLNPLPVRRRKRAGVGVASILVSFGAEDRKGLTLPVVDMLLTKCGIEAERITVVQGPVFKNPLDLPAGVKRLDSPACLRELLADYNCLITSFGLTAVEALSAGVAVITVNPSRYHSRLARTAGLPVVTPASSGGGRLAALLKSPEALRAGSEKAARVLDLTNAVPPPLERYRPGSTACPGCGARGNQVIGRNPARTFYRCRRCRLMYQSRWLPDTTIYDESYFFDSYRAQYGRSYLEDFDTIREEGRRRLDAIRVEGPAPALLDIGCAYGPFLAAAAEGEYRVEGVEPAPAAASHAAAVSGGEVHSLTLEQFRRRFPDRSWDVVTLWYVIEHFAELNEVLAGLTSMVRPGGILALSTPNGAGISARRNLKSFLSASPADHYTILTPRSIKRLLKRHGFRVEAFSVPTLHRDRFPRFAAWCWPVARLFASWLLLGDTFEVYARRVEGSSR